MFKKAVAILLISGFFVQIFLAPLVSALDSSTLNEYAQNDILFYDPTCSSDSNSGKTCVQPSGDQITWIGDSLTALDEGGAYGSETIDSMFPGVDYGGTFNGCTVSDYVRSGKTVTSDTTVNDCVDGNTGPSGMHILENIISQGKLRPYLVFALGANEDWNENTLKEVMDLAGNDTQVIIMTSLTKDNNYETPNAVLKNASYDNLTIIDWASELSKHPEYFFDGIHYTHDGYKAYLQFIKDNLPTNCSGTLCGSTAKEKYWSALSNLFGAAAAAGILGNIDNEGGFNPVSYETCTIDLNPFDMSTKTWINGWSWDRFYSSDTSASTGRPTGTGAFGITSGRSEYLQYVNETAPDLLEYWKNPTKYNFNVCSASDLSWPEGSDNGGDALLKTIGDTDFDRLVQVEVEWMYKTLENDSTFDLNSFQNMSDPGEAAIYFMLHYERPEDQSSSAQQNRANSGREEYEEFKNFECSQAGASTNFSSTSTLSSAANVKYDASPDEINQLLKFAVWEAQETDGDYKEILSTILDDFEKNNGSSKSDTKKVIEYVEGGEKFKYREEYDKYVKSSTEIKLTSEQEEEAKTIISDGIRTTSDGKATIVSENSSNDSDCPDDDSTNGKGAATIAETAALMAWPVQSWQTSASDFKSDRVGKCYNDFDGEQKGWINYTFDVTCTNTPRDLYKQASSGEGRLDCGVFSLTVLKYLKLIDDTTFGDGQPGAGDYFRAHPDEWKEIKITSEDDLEPGDVLWNKDHIMIYIGEEYGGDYGTLAHASVGNYDGEDYCGSCQLPGHGGRVGEISSEEDSYLITFTAFRYIGSKLGGDEISEEGLTEEQATKLANNYNSNKGDWSGYPNNIKVANYYNYCHSEGNYICASDYSNCTLFSAFFAEMFWGVSQQGWPNGGEMVNKLAGLGYKTGSEPKVFAIFSTTDFHGDNHTGVVVAVDGDKIATIEAGYPRENAVYKDFASISGKNITFAYPDSVDTAKLMEFINQ